MSLSIVLTCYHEVPLIFESYGTLSAMMQATEIDHEFIIVDDGSGAEVQRALEDFFGKSEAKLILMAQNEGRGAAVTRGFRSASKEYVAFIDTDLEIPPHALLALYSAAVVEGADTVVAERVYQWNLRPTNIIRILGSRGLRLFSSIMLRLNGMDTETGAKLFRRRALADILDDVHDAGWFWDTEIVAEAVRHSQRVVQVPIVVRRNNSKKSSVHLVGDTLTYIKAVCAYKFKQRVKHP